MITNSLRSKFDSRVRGAEALDTQTTDWQNCNFYLTDMGTGGMGMWWNIPVSGEWFSDRFFAASGECYQPGDTVGDTKDN
jgi:hypothetical protein